jgi:hypothetical protein
MTGSLVLGDHVSCSRVGGAMRRESSPLGVHAQSLADAVEKLATAQGASASPLVSPATSLATIKGPVRALKAAADGLDQAGAALQRYATDLAQGHELARQARRRVEGAGLLLDGTRVLEPWGPASPQEAEHRRAQVPEVQARVDLATAHVGRARSRLRREMTRLSASFPTQPQETQAARQPPSPSGRQDRHRLGP